MLAKTKISTFIVVGILSLCFLLVSYGGEGDAVRAKAVEIRIEEDKAESRSEEKSKMKTAFVECDECPSKLQMDANSLNEELDSIIEEIQTQQIARP